MGIDGCDKFRNRDPQWNYAMRSIGSGGETLGTELLDWGRDTFGLTINEFYGQTECNLVVGNCASIMPIRPGSMARAIPGHTVGIIDDDGYELADGDVGGIAVQQPGPPKQPRKNSSATGSELAIWATATTRVVFGMSAETTISLPAPAIASVPVKSKIA